MRFVKYETFLDDDLAQQSHAARLLFIGLWTLADRAGRLEDKPAKIKAQLFPYEQVDIEHLLTELACGFIVRYEVSGKRLIQIKNFAKHQRPHHKEPDSTYPAPADPGLPGKGTSQPGGSLVLGSGSLVLGSGVTTAAPLAVDYSQVRITLGKYRSVYVTSIPVDECQVLLRTDRLGKKYRAAIEWRIAQKQAEMSPAQREASQ